MTYQKNNNSSEKQLPARKAMTYWKKHLTPIRKNNLPENKISPKGHTYSIFYY